MAASLFNSAVSTLPAHLASVLVCALAAMATVVVGLLRGRRPFLPALPGALYVLFAALALWPPQVPGLPPALARWAVPAAALALLLWIVLELLQGIGATDEPSGPAAPRVYLVAALALSGALLFYNLGGYAGSLLIWEAPVVSGFPEQGGFAAPYENGVPVWRYTAQRLLWDDGLLSAGHTSLFYGAPTYALFHLLSPSAWSLRFSAALAVLLCVLVTFASARRPFGPVTAAAAAVAIGLNSCLLFYGRYGSSPAGTALAVLLALWSVWAFLDRDRSAWWLGGVCAVALAAATFQYSTARIVVLVLLGIVGLALLVEWRRLSWQRAVGALLIGATALVLWQTQNANHTAHLFLAARGEQFFAFINQPDQIESLFGKNILGRPLTGAPLTLADKMELFVRVIETTWQQYADLLRPVVQTAALGDGQQDAVLPQLYYAPLAIFIVWGVAHSLLRVRQWPHASLLAWQVLATIPLLLTNRVDTHRAMLFLIPLAFWTGLGVREAARVMRRARVPVAAQHAVALLLMVTVVYADVAQLHRAPVPSAAAGETLAAVAESVPGRVFVAALIDHRDLGWVHLGLLDRMRRDPNRAASLYSENALHVIEDQNGGPSENQIRRLLTTLETSTILFAPAHAFRKTAAALQARGARVAEQGSADLRVLRVDMGAAASGVPDDVVRPLPTIVIPPSPTPVPLRQGLQISLSQLTPTNTSFGFKPLQVDRSWDGAPIIIAGVKYPTGLGMHAWARATYAVPAGASAFQAIIGLADSAHGCPEARVTFEVRDQKDTLLFDSGPVDTATNPRPIFVPLHGATAMTLVVTEGGNGRDCDHAVWASAAFLVQR